MKVFINLQFFSSFSAACVSKFAFLSDRSRLSTWAELHTATRGMTEGRASAA